MKNRLRTISLIVIIFLSLQSCQKNVTQTNQPIVVTDDSIMRLSKLVYFDPASSPTDTIYTTEFTYDTLHRVITIEGIEYNNRTPSSLESITFYYTGSDTITYRSVLRESGTPYIDETYYFYDNAQKLIKDSVIFNNISASGVSVTRYKYSTNMITSGSNSLDTGYIGSNGDVILSNTLTNDTRFTSNFTYDNHPNPFYQLNIHTSYYPIPDEVFDIDLDYLTKNNTTLISVQNISSPAYSFQLSYSYTYNSLGLPLTATGSYDNGVTVYQLIQFLYKRI